LANKVKYRYKSLEDFLIFNPLLVDGQLDERWEPYSLSKGREIGANILFFRCDRLTTTEIYLNLSPEDALRPFPGLNLESFLAGIWIVFLVWGFTPFLAFLSITSNVPKPTKVTFSSLTRQSVLAEIIASTASLDVFLVSPV